MEPLWQDLRCTTRTLLKRSLITLLVVLTLALGIGANTAIFSVLDAVAFRSLSFNESDRIISLGETNSGWSSTLASSHAFVSWLERGASFEGMAATAWWDANLESGPEPKLISATGDYFSVMGVEPILGRAFLPEEMARGGPKSAIVSYPIWQRLGAYRDIIGQPPRMGSDSFTVVGVMPPAAGAGLSIGWGDVWVPSQMDFQAVKTPPGGWRGFRIMAHTTMTLAIRTTNDPAGLVPQCGARFKSSIHRCRSSRVMTLDGFIGRSIAGRRLSAWLFGFFASLALLLAAVGVYGELSYSTEQRAREIGLRLALGAQRSDVLRLIVGQGLKAVAEGVLIGLATALALSRAMKSLLFGVTATDPLTFAGVASLLVIVAFVACFIPARRAAKADPMVSLRRE
ncbi:MAG: ABC transporter permease [Chloracidobacterium sp.]|nr:ABC transporter permease [Chloracidobacterium sp.]